MCSLVQCRTKGGIWGVRAPPPPPPPPPRRGCEFPKKPTFFTHYMILRVYTVMHNWERLIIWHNSSAERKCGRGGTDKTVSVTRAGKWWDFKSPVVWSRRIKHFCAPSQSQTKKLGNLGCVLGGGHLSPVPRLWGWSVCPPPHLPFPWCFHCKFHVV